MASQYEKAVANQAIYKISEVTPPENPAAEIERGMNRINYMPQDKIYQGRTSIADIVKEDRKPDNLYQNSVRAMRENDPEKEIYSDLLNYEFIN